jgi:hypothetical protein
MREGGKEVYKMSEYNGVDCWAISGGLTSCINLFSFILIVVVEVYLYMRLITVVEEMREWGVLRVAADGGLIGCSVGGLFHRPQY